VRKGRIQPVHFIVVSFKGIRVTEAPRKPASTGDSAAADSLEAAFVRWQSELLGTLFYLTGNLEDARDALQESFIKCWRHRDQVPDVHNLKAWIFRIALNTGRDLRQSAWRRRRQSMPGGEEMIESAPSDPQATLEKSERVELVRRAVRELRSEEQEVFLLRQNGELTYEEIAETIGIPTGTVKTRMRLALTKLRKALATP